jgi:two-component system response regulator ChvI
MNVKLADSRVVAVIDDEKNIRDTVSYALTQEGYTVRAYKDGQDAWEAFKETLPDCAIIDIVMPRMDGLELTRKLRSVTEKMPIVFLTSRDEEIDRVVGLEIGGDDYLTKPFSLRELLVRIKVLFRRLGYWSTEHEHEKSERIEYGGLSLDMGCYTVSWNGAHIELTVTEFLLLKSLAESPGRVRTRNDLMELGYSTPTYVSDRTIDSHIKRIRAKFENIDPGFDRIETVYGLGYRYKQNTIA